MNNKELDFVVFIINKYARAEGISVPTTYKLLNDSDLINGYLVKCYNVLHTLGEAYLINDLKELIEIGKEK
jgi:hypothetical protein